MASAEPKAKVKRSPLKKIFNGTTAIAENALLMKIGDLYRVVGAKGVTSPRGTDFSEEEKTQLTNLLQNYGKIIKDKLIVNTGSNFDVPKNTPKSDIKNVKFNSNLLAVINKKVASLGTGLGKRTFQAVQGALVNDYNYCGSGTDIFRNLNKGVFPKNIVDYHCMIHDLQYLTIGAYGLKGNERATAVDVADKQLQDAVSIYKSIPKDLKDPSGELSQISTEASLVSLAMSATRTANSVSRGGSTNAFIQYYNKFESSERKQKRKKAYDNVMGELNSEFAKQQVGNNVEYKAGLDILDTVGGEGSSILTVIKKEKLLKEDVEIRQAYKGEGDVSWIINRLENTPAQTETSVLGKRKDIENPEVEDLPVEPRGAGANDPFAEDRPPREPPIEVAPGVTVEEEEGLGVIEPVGAGAGEEVKEEEEVEEDEGQVVPVGPAGAGGGQLVDATPVDLDELKKQRERVGQFRRSDLNIQQSRGDPPLNTMGLTDAKPVVGERNMRPLLFREEGDTIKLTQFEENENRLFYENFTWVDSGFGNGNIQRLPGSLYAGKDLANNRLYDAQMRNEKLKFSGRLFTGPQQYRKKYDISAQTRKLIEVPMFSTVQNHQEFIRDSSLPAGAGRPHQMARDEVSFIRRKNVNNKVGRLFYPDLVDGKRL